MITQAIISKVIYFHDYDEYFKIASNKLLKKEYDNRFKSTLKIMALALVYFCYAPFFVGNAIALFAYSLSQKISKQVKQYDYSDILYKALNIESSKIAPGIHYGQYRKWKMENIDFIANNREISIEFDFDHILSKNICNITHSCIKHPVYEVEYFDNGNEKRIYYEKFAIKSCLDFCSKSPVTHKPLKYQDLFEDHELEKIIADRLQQLYENPNKFIASENFNTMIRPGKIVIVENPEGES